MLGQSNIQSQPAVMSQLRTQLLAEQQQFNQSGGAAAAGGGAGGMLGLLNQGPSPPRFNQPQGLQGT